MMNETLAALFSESGSDLPTLAANLGISVALLSIFFVIISIWSLTWKGIALWKSSQKKSLVWFIVLLVVNTIGILEILYIFIFSKMNMSSKPKRKK